MVRSEQLANGAEAQYWQALLEGRLELPRCAECERWHWPAVWRCAECGSWKHDWVNLPMQGKIFTWTRCWHRFGGLENFDLPFVILVVELPAANGARLLGLLKSGSDVEASPRIGASVHGRVSQIEFHDETIPTIYWSMDERE